MGKVIINGKTYDSLTGLQIRSESQVESPVLVASEIAVEPEQAPIAAPIAKATSPKAKRVSKQERLAAAVAEEFASDERGQRESARKATKTKIAADTDEAPAWIANFVEGHEPVEIEPIRRAEPIETAQQSKQRDHSPAEHYNRNRVQRSQTLNRRFVKKPAIQAHVAVNRQRATTITKHPNVHRFAPDVVKKAAPPTKTPQVTASATKAPATIIPDIPFTPTVSHHVAKTLVTQAAPAATLSSSELKDFLIQNQLDQPIDQKAQKKAEKSAAKFGTRRRFTRASLVTAALAFAVLGGYMTYINMPSLSVRVAASRAGIDTSSPYTPNGYSLDGPVAYSPGHLTIKYKSNSGSAGYSISEQNTALSSQEAFNSLESGTSHTTTDLDGITIYHYGDNASWVKNGVLYTLNGNALLSDDQIVKIVQSV